METNYVLQHREEPLRLRVRAVAAIYCLIILLTISLKASFLRSSITFEPSASTELIMSRSLRA